MRDFGFEGMRTFAAILALCSWTFHFYGLIACIYYGLWKFIFHPVEDL